MYSQTMFNMHSTSEVNLSYNNKAGNKLLPNHNEHINKKYSFNILLVIGWPALI